MTGAGHGSPRRPGSAGGHVSAGETARRRVVVHGRIQGVSFRDATRKEAARHDVAGWVANRADGTVEAVFEGRPDAVQRMVEFSHAGSPQAAVERVDDFDEEPEGLSGFEVR